MSSHDNSSSTLLWDLAAIAGSIAVIALTSIAIVSGLSFFYTVVQVVWTLETSEPPLFNVPPVGVYWALLYFAVAIYSVWLLKTFYFAIEFWAKVSSILAGVALVAIVFAAVFIDAFLVLHIVLGTIMMCFPIAAVLAFISFLKGDF